MYERIKLKVFFTIVINPLPKFSHGKVIKWIKIQSIFILYDRQNASDKTRNFSPIYIIKSRVVTLAYSIPSCNLRALPLIYETLI